MLKPETLFILSAIYFAPHLSPTVGVWMGVFYLVLTWVILLLLPGYEREK